MKQPNVTLNRFQFESNPLAKKGKKAIAALLIAVLLSSVESRASDILWSSPGGSAWLTNTNWTGSAVPGATDNAQFGVNPTAATGVGINMSNPTNNGAKNQVVGSIEITNARSNGIIIGNSSTSAGADGTLTINGTTVNSVSNVILRSNATGGTLTIQNTQNTGNKLMSVTLTNATDNVVVIDGAGSISVASALASATTSHVTLQGSGTGMFKIWPGLTSMPDSVAITGTSLGFGVNVGGTGEWTNDPNAATVGSVTSLIDARNALGTQNKIFWNSGNSFGIDSSNATGGTLTYSGVIGSFRTGTNPTDTTNNIGFAKLGTNTLQLSGNNTYTGTTTFGGGVLQVGGANAINPNALLIGVAGASFDVNGFSQSVTSISGAGTIALGSTGTLTVTSPSNETFSGVFTASAGGKFIKNGSGALTLSGSSTGFGGEMVLNTGTIGVDNSNAFGPVTSGSSTLTINGGNLSNKSVTGRTIPSGVSLNLNADFSVDDSLFATPGQILFLGPATIKNSNRTITVTGNGNLGLADVREDVAGRKLTKDGGGTLALTGTATGTAFTGDVTVLAGRLQVNGAGIIGTGNNPVHLSGGSLSTSATRSTAISNPIDVAENSSITNSISTAATVDMPFSSNSISAASGRTLTLKNEGADGPTDIFQPRFTGTFAYSEKIAIDNGPVGKTRLNLFNTAATGDETFSGVISGNGSVGRSASLINTGGSTIMSAQNTYTGGTSLDDGTIVFGVDSVGTPSSPTSGPIGTGTLSINSYAGTSAGTVALKANGGARTVGNAIAMNVGLASTLSVAAGSSDLTLTGTVNLGGFGRILNIASGIRTEMSGVVSGSGSGTTLTKSGDGTLVLSGENTYSGNTSVSAGTLLVNNTGAGSGASTGSVTVASGATLGGTGTIGGPITVQEGGTLAPGASVGTLTTTNNVTFDANSHFAVELSGASADKLVVGGNLDLSASEFLDVTGTGSGSSWLIATYTGLLSGTFNTITSGYEVDTLTNPGQILLKLTGGSLPGDWNLDGHVNAADYVTWRKTPGAFPVNAYDIWRANFGNPGGSGAGLNGASVPEPAAIALVLLGLAMFVGRRR